MSDEDRIISIESKIAYQEDLMQTLNDTVIEQQQRISALEHRYQSVLERLSSLDPPSTVDADERPPHY
jgi:SlyX protein